MSLVYDAFGKLVKGNALLRGARERISAAAEDGGQRQADQGAASRALTSFPEILVLAEPGGTG